MAKHGRGRGRRRMGRYIRGNIDVDMALGTLAPKTLLVQAVADTVVERTFVSSIKCNYAMAGFTVGDNIGPIRIGVSHGDYTAAEIEAWLETTLSWDEGDLIAREVAGRRCRNIGVFQAPPGGGLGPSYLNDGKSFRLKLGWILNAGQTLDFWAYNEGSAALATTDPNVHISGHANLWPK